MQSNGRFSTQAREVLIVAQNEADNRRHNFIDTDHIILAIIAQQTSVGAPKALRDSGVDYEMLSKLVGQNPYATSSKRLELSRDAKRMLELAVVEMQRKAEKQISVEYLLVGLLQIETSAGVELLFQAKCDIRRLYATMDVSLPERVLRQYKQSKQQAETFDDDKEDNEGCLGMMITRLKELFMRGKL